MLVFGLFKKAPPPPPPTPPSPPMEPPKRFPPIPEWQPTLQQPVDRIVDRMRYYTDGKKDFAMLTHGTCVVLADGLSDDQAAQFSDEVLRRIFNAHPDMNPVEMDDGNVLVRYNHPAANVVLSDFVRDHWDLIDQNHQGALATDEVLITPLGPNRFDDFGKKALFGRCFMFMDALDPKVVNVHRKGA